MFICQICGKGLTEEEGYVHAVTCRPPRNFRGEQLYRIEEVPTVEPAEEPEEEPEQPEEQPEQPEEQPEEEREEKEAEEKEEEPAKTVESERQ